MKRMTYRYSVFGLSVTSELALPELPSSETTRSDVHIQLSDLQEKMNGLTADHPYRLTEGTFSLYVPGVAHYFVASGTMIEVDLIAGTEIEAVKLFLLGSCMGIILHQRGILPMHGSVITDGETGILLTGHSGAGKSTTAHRFLAQGYHLVTDDVAATRFEDDAALVAPAYGHQKLWEDVLPSSGIGYTRVNREVDRRTKYTVDRERQFWNESVRLRLIVELVPADIKYVQHETVTGMDKVRTLMLHTYRNIYYKELQKEAFQFESAMALARRVRLLRIYRPQGIASEQTVVELITAAIKEGIDDGNIKSKS